MQNFSPLALKPREEIEHEGQADCKNAKY